MTRRWQREMVDTDAKPEPNAGRKCGFCGKPSAPQYLLLMGYCSRNCLNDSLGETDSDRGD